MSRSGAWRIWPLHNPALVEELIQRIKQEIAQRSDEEYKFQIGSLEFWHHHESYEVRRVDLDWSEKLVIRGEKNTNAFSDWGSKESADYTLKFLRQRQILEDMASA